MTGLYGASLEPLLAAKEIVVFCGSGGVGKTTTAAAAAAMAAASLGGRVLVITVDPARRLADALGMKAIGNVEVRVPSDLLDAACADVTGGAARGQLWAVMLDARQSWDDLVHRHAPDRTTATKILGNPLYQNISQRFVQSHGYIAMERLYEIHATGAYDLIVVDTPPSRDALELLDAPERMADFFASRLLRWLIMPARSRVLNLATRPFSHLADRILGSQFIQDITEFFLLFQSMHDGFVERAEAVTRLLHDRRTSFVVVSTLEAAPVREAEHFMAALGERGLHTGALVLNKVLPGYLDDPDAGRTAGRLVSDAPGLAENLAQPHGLEADDVARVLGEVGESFANFGVVAKREAEQRAELAATPDVVVTVPHSDTDICDLAGLLKVGRAMWSA